MKPKHLLFSLLLTLLAVWQYGFFRYAQQLPNPNVYSAVLLGISLSQITLSAAWVGFGTGGLTIRFTSLTIAVWISAYLNSHVWNATFTEWIGVFLLFSSIVVIPLLVIRSSIGQMGNESSSSSNQIQGNRFTLGFLISLMTVCSLTMGTIRIGSLPWDHVLAVALSCLIFAAIALATTWCLSRNNRLRIFTLPPLFLGAVWSLAAINHLPMSIFLVIVGVQVGVVAVALEVLQIQTADEVEIAPQTSGKVF